MKANVKGPTREQFTPQQWQAFGNLIDTVERIVRGHRQREAVNAGVQGR